MTPRSLFRGVLFALRIAVPVGIGFFAGLTPASPATEQAEQVNVLYLLIFGIAIAIFVAVEALIVWAIIRYQRRDDRLPPQFHGNLRLEIIWTAIPSVIVVVVFVLSLQALAVVEERREEVGATILVDGFQWQWSFTYEGTNITETGTQTRPAVMRVPVGEPVRLILNSDDVVHAFFVPNFLIKRDVNPYPEGVANNTLEFTVTEAGEYTGQCAEFCGLLHAQMTFTVQALPRAEYDAWLAEAAGGQAPDDGEGDGTTETQSPVPAATQLPLPSPSP